MAGFRAAYDDGGLGERYARPQRAIVSPLVPMVDRLTRRGADVGQRAVRNDTRRLMGSIVPKRAAVVGTRVVGEWGTGERHALPNELGRRAGARMPPKGVLLGWMGRRGIPAQREFVIRRAIARRGIPPQPFMAPGEAEVRRALGTEKFRAARAIVVALAGGR